MAQATLPLLRLNGSNPRTREALIAAQSRHVLRQPTTLQKAAIAFLALEGAGGLVWWFVMLLFPAARAPFLATGAPDSTLLAFLVPDVVLYMGAAFLSAYGLARRAAWGWPVLLVHTGAATYAALYELALALLSGGAWLGAIFMLPSLLVLPPLVWLLQPESVK